MKISILTLFPQMIFDSLQYSILGRAQKNKLLEIEMVNLRAFGLGKYKQVDDRPYGGGIGMVMRVDVIEKALLSIKEHSGSDPEGFSRSEGIDQRIILLDPKGGKFNQPMARRFSKLKHLILICGHYEGVDARVDKLVDEKISIGDYILTGGEIPAMAIVDSVARLLSGVLSKPEAIKYETFSTTTLPTTTPSPKRRGQGKVFFEPPQYTRPEKYQKMNVPKILLSGDPKKIEEWQKSKVEKLSKS